MPVPLQRKQSPLDIDNPIISILSAGTSYTFERRRETEGFWIASSTAVTVDLGSQLLREMIEWKRLPANPLIVQVSEVQEWEKLVEKINAIEAVSGLFNELTSEQMEIFEAAVKRRPFFE